MSQAMKNGTRKRFRLSEVARHVKIPEGVVATGWPAVRDRCAQFGVFFDGWQDGAGRLILSKRADGSYAASVGGAVLSVPRQVGKTYLVGWLVFGLCTLFPDLLVIWTAHHSRTSDETFAGMRDMANNAKAVKYVDFVRSANGQQEVKFKNGSRILFGAREHGFGRGIAKIDVLVLDEAQILSESAMANMVPATNAADNGLVIMMGTPPRLRDPSEAFSARREDALAGDADTLYVEFSADPKAKIVDWEQLGKANPSFPHRTGKNAVLRMQKLLGSDDNFRREAYGIWDEAAAVKRAIPFTSWQVLVDDDPPKSGVKCFGVKFTPDGSTVALAGGIRPPGGVVHVEAIKQLNTGSGVAEIVDFLVARADETSMIVVDGKAGAGALVQELLDAGLKRRGLVHVPSVSDVVAAHAMLDEAIKAGSVSHFGDKFLDAQVRDAVRRPIGKTGAFGWAGVDGSDVGLLDAVTLAFWAARTARGRGGGRAAGRAGAGRVVATQSQRRVANAGSRRRI